MASAHCGLDKLGLARVDQLENSWNCFVVGRGGMGGGSEGDGSFFGCNFQNESCSKSRWLVSGIPQHHQGRSPFVITNGGKVYNLQAC